MIGQFSVPLRADEIQIGTGNSTDYNLPTHSNYDYSLTQQIYTAEEIETAGGGDGTINSISFYNAGSEKTRTLDVYLANTDKASFANSSDWIAITSSNLVYSGSVTFTAGTWTTITFTMPFAYDGSNLAVIVDDNTGGYSSGLSCRTFTASSTQSIYSRRDNYNIDPSNPINGTPVTTKNQIKLDIEFASETCAKPKNLNATNITAHTATLTWTAGAEGQSNWEVFVTTDATIVPDESTTPTYQVTECSKSLSNLAAQTTYYAYVRSACGGSDGNSKWAKKVFTTTREALAVDASHPYSQDFETTNDWGFTNGDLTNKWCWGSATDNGGSKAMYISNDNGTSNAYTLSSTTVVYASKLFAFEQGTYTFVFDWKAYGESGYSEYDYLRVALVSGDMDFTAGTTLPQDLNATSLPSSWIALDGGHQLNKSSEWQAQTAEATVSGTYTMVFVWRNDSGGGDQPPAAIDNISISFMTCPRPTNLTASNITGRTATLSWTENGTATNWVLQYATNNSFTENLVETNVSGMASKGLSGLSPETKYYARVKSVLGNDESSWSDVKDFTTTATCVKPTNVTANDITAHEATIGWTNGEEGQNAWEISYSTSQQSNPENGSVIPVTDNPFTLTGLSPETSYYVYVRANCGDEDGKSAWSSYKNFTTLATCIKPTSLTASNVTSSTATITWTAGETGQNRWNLEYKKSTESTWQSAVVENNPTYSLDNLSPVTAYNVRVQADCGDGDLSQWAETTFTTGCGAINLPYTCDFEGTSQTVNSCTIPSCWSVIRGYYNSSSRYGVPTMATPSTSTQPIVQQTHSGSYSLYFLNSTHYGTSEEYAILPEISGGYNMRDIQIRFWVRSYSSPCTMEVGVMTDPSNANTYVKVEDVEITKDYTEKTISLNNYSGIGRYIALKCPAPSMYSQAFYVDDILVEYIPSCQVPDNLAADEVGVNEVSLSWTPRGDESAWNIQYKEASDDEWSNPIAVNVTTYTLTGLQRSTLYEARVQANCDDNDQSDWTNPISFTTECGIWTIDDTHALVENFNSTAFPPTCWQKVNFGEMGVTNGWLQTSNNPLDSQGAVSSDFKGETWLFLPHMHIEGNATLSFDNLFSTGTSYCTSSIMVSTDAIDNLESIKEEGFIGEHFTQIRAADPTKLPSNKQNETVSLSDYAGQDVYIAFRYEGSNTTTQRIWYIDNVQVFVPTTQTVTLSQGWNWWSPTVETSLEQLEAALGDKGVTIKAQNGKFANYEDDEWDGNLTTIIPGQMYKIQVNNNCEFVLSGIALSSVSIIIEQGQNWIGHTSMQVVSINQAFNNFTPVEGDRITSFDGKFTSYEDGEWSGTLTQLQPGQGYVYISQDTNSKTLIINEN